MNLTPESVLPDDPEDALLVARVHEPEWDGPCVAAVRGAHLVDLTSRVPTVADLLEREDAGSLVRDAQGGRRWPLDEVLAATASGRRDVPHLLAPVDLQVIKAAGVTFAESLMERVIEERTGGDPTLAARTRERLVSSVGPVTEVRPGSPEAAKAKEILQADGLWSQYLEVGIGPDPEVFTKAPVLSAVGTGARIGVLASSVWNNPEPEVVLAADSRGRVRGALLGNDVNLRDVEGRSALLLPRAKDNNASCALGPFLRLFDDAGARGGGFGLDDVRELEVALDVTGTDGFVLEGSSSMRRISRDVLELVASVHGDHHQHPDGFVLFTGTLFAPTQDRDAPGEGFTHHEGDVVRISSPRLGSLVNTVTTSEAAPPWEYGIRRLMRNLAGRGVL
ncbi:fumarylacetoacetate hydrolase family protein [Streptomyces sp. YC504]|uniref:Fumarylacetoacetate hydrolase family protein n=1 Tax=Streptomyces mesophilus TaxID=1775132 RepID=A0A6G4XQM3_9ACTN|nr:fumarylacetoacetate hydrolase family protein [Streptomyces mesophilus]NGO78901.1 fumarylacetoacetate hydrolase family protein [Streptomyces mesophilus]